MKTAKLVIGIVSIVLFVFIAFQSCAAGMSNALEANGEMSGTAGLLTGILMMTAGIIGIATRNGKKGGAYTAGGFYVAAAAIGFFNAGSYGDLKIWAVLSLIFGIVFIAGTMKGKRGEDGDEK